ncbi:MAG TPA: hypothetical protein VE621_08755 [Bryobacteraceae bacterium]|jgi:hypothetical protein|nr:hypothetical protein [Bryobacteraceae bacterium]
MKGFVVRNEQLDRFRNEKEEELARVIRNDLERNHPQTTQGLSPAIMAYRIRTGIDRARTHGLSKQYAVAMFVELMFLIGPDFDEYPPFKATLRRKDLKPDDRIDVLVAETTERQWQNARLRYNPAAWGVPA